MKTKRKIGVNQRSSAAERIFPASQTLGVALIASCCTALQNRDRQEAGSGVSRELPSTQECGHASQSDQHQHQRGGGGLGRYTAYWQAYRRGAPGSTFVRGVLARSVVLVSLH